MAYTGYQFYINDYLLPYAPSELKVSIGSNNKTVNLINGNEINILKSPKLTEIEFEIELPRGRQYAFANRLVSPIRFTDLFEQLKLKKSPTELVITRPNPSGGTGTTENGFVGSSWTVSLEDYTLKESADNAYDIKVALKFKEYIEYGTVKVVVENKVNPSPKPQTNNNKIHIVKTGDCLWNIARKYYGNALKWKVIYRANETVIENAARQHGRKSSSNGWWIYPGTKLIIPVG